MRYINKLELPFAPGDDFRRFLTTSPVLPDEVPRNFSEFLTRVIAHEDASDGPAIVITQSLVHTGDKLSGGHSVLRVDEKAIVIVDAAGVEQIVRLP